MARSAAWRPVVTPYRFPPMLGPADDWPVGSSEWALRLANELSYTVLNAAEFGVEPIVPLVIKAIEHSPWKIWPEPPAGSIDRFFLHATGFEYRQIHTLISECIRNKKLARQLAAAKGRDESEIGQGSRTDLQHHVQHMKLTQGSGNADYLLRRLARDHPAIMRRWEAGAFPTVRAAARAAGIKVDPTPLQALRRAWQRAGVDERAEFLAEVTADRGTGIRRRTR